MRRSKTGSVSGIFGALFVATFSVAASADDLPPPPPALGDQPPAEGQPSAAPADQTVAPVPPPADGSAPPKGIPAPVDISSDTDKAAAAAATEANGPAPEEGEGSKNLNTYMSSKNAQRFTGRPITLNVKDVEAADVFRLISEASGFNIILAEDVKGRLTMSLTDVPWDQALDVVLHTLHLGAERNNNILRIMTLTGLTAEKQEQLKALKAAEASTPKVTKVFPINYATLGDIQTTVTKFIGAASAAGPTDVGSPAVIQADQRTNSLIVRDIPDNIERIRKLVDVLDTQTPQVLIESKVIEASEGFTRNITGTVGAGSAAGASTALFGSVNGTDPSTALVSIPTGAGISSVGFSPSISFIPGLSRLNAILSLTESESKSKTIASPRFVVLNKQSATITQSTPVTFATSSVSGGVVTAGVSTTQANLTMTATPTVTNDGSVLLQLTLSRDVPQLASGVGGTAVANRNMNTQVLVESGSTLVLGGIYTSDNTHSEAGFPFLRRIPILGALFGTDSNSNTRTELFFFITPRILNPKEAGLSS